VASADAVSTKKVKHERIVIVLPSFVFDATIIVIISNMSRRITANKTRMTQRHRKPLRNALMMTMPRREEIEFGLGWPVRRKNGEGLLGDGESEDN